MPITGLAKARSRRGWTQIELALRTGVSPSAIHRIEAGRSLGSAETLIPLADALDVSLDELVGRKWPKTTPAPNPPPSGRIRVDGVKAGA